MYVSRRRPSGLLLGLALLLVAMLVPEANAQGLLGAGVPGLPFFGGSSAGSCGPSGACCEPCCPGGLKLDAGYLWGKRAVQIGATSPIGTFFSRYPIEGVQVGATLQAPLKDNFGVMLRGTWLFPNNRTGELDVDLIAVADATLTWSTKTQYYTVDGAAVYPFCAPLSFLAGFRFDSLDIGLRNPRSASAFFAASLPADRGDVQIDSYIPYVGLGLNNGPLRLSLIGTPIFWGNLRFRRSTGGIVGSEHHDSFKNTYFVEASTEYGLSVGPGSAAVLAKWTYMHATGSPTFEQTVGGGLILQNPVSTDLIRQHFYLGGSFTVPLSSPF